MNLSILASAALGLVFAAAPVAAGTPPALTYGGNPAHTGVYATQPLVELTGEKWRFTVDGETTGSPVISDGAVYFSSKNGVVHAVSLDDGTGIWRFETGTKLYNAPAIADGTAFVGCPDGNVYALDLSTGKEIWRYETGGAICGAPAVHDGVAWAGSHYKTLYLLDTATGKPVGKFEEAWDVCCTPSVSGGVVFYPDWGGNLHAVDIHRDDLVFPVQLGFQAVKRAIVEGWVGV